MLGKTQNPLLQKTEKAVQFKLKPQDQSGFQRVMTAGLTVMYSGQGHQVMIDQLTKQGDPAHNAAEGAAKLIGNLFQQSKGTLPMNLAIPAATVFMCEALSFLEEAGKVKITPDLLASAMKDLSAYVLQVFRVSQDKLHAMMAQQGSQQAAPQAPQASGIINGNMGV